MTNKATKNKFWWVLLIFKNPLTWQWNFDLAMSVENVDEIWKLKCWNSLTLPMFT